MDKNELWADAAETFGEMHHDLIEQRSNFIKDLGKQGVARTMKWRMMTFVAAEWTWINVGEVMQGWMKEQPTIDADALRGRLERLRKFHVERQLQWTDECSSNPAENVVASAQARARSEFVRRFVNRWGEV